MMTQFTWEVWKMSNGTWLTIWWKEPSGIRSLVKQVRM